MADRGSVLVVEDERTIAAIVARYLERAGYDTRVARDGQSALAEVTARRPDLVVLDLGLPRVDGLEVMRRIRADPCDRVAVILLTARAGTADRIAGLRLGADDYVVKPFSPAELVARADAVLRRIDASTQRAEPLRFGDLEIDPVGRRVRLAAVDVPLAHREFELLLFLARRPGQVVSRERIMKAVWGHQRCVDSSTVTVHVRRLRTKIERDPARPRLLRTVRGVGYRFQP